jgi:hypothetical protein
MYLNAKQDLQYAKENNPEWELEYKKLLDGEYRWINTGQILGTGIVDATHKIVKTEVMGITTINQFEWMPDPWCRMYEIRATRAEILELTGWDDPGIAPKEWTPGFPPALTWDDIRTQRNTLMAACDWTQLPDAVLTFTERQLWQDYRQALRDIPQIYATPDAVIWPEKP